MPETILKVPVVTDTTRLELVLRTLSHHLTECADDLARLRADQDLT